MRLVPAIRSTLCGFLCLGTANAHADVTVRFIEGAPKDRFVIANEGNCAIDVASVTIDLARTAGRLIFDVTDQGAGVEVFQPLEIVEGSGLLASVPSVRDGDRQITLAMGTLPAGGRVGFTIDVDDTVSSRQITVDGAEIDGGTVALTGSRRGTAVFGADARARIATGC